MSSIIHLLFLTSVGFLFVSSAAADNFGLQQIRVATFSLLVALLTGIALAYRPRFSSRDAALPLSMIGLLAIIAVVDVGGVFDVFDYKIVLPVLVVLAAPSLAKGLDCNLIVLRIRQVLGAYIGVTAASLLIGGQNVIARGFESIVRVDFSGSVVSHSSLCAIYIVLTLTALWNRRSDYRLVETVLVGLAVWMLMLTATRTAVVTLVLFGLLALHVGRYRVADQRLALGVAMIAVAVFVTYNATIDDSFLRRFDATENENFSSGRLDSLEHWLRLTEGSPMGLGLGAIRNHLADGRPALDGERLLEWPHNEFVRYYVEAGQLGLVLIVLMVGGVSSVVLRASRESDDPLRRNLMLVIVADMIAQACFQNYFNTVYHSTVLIMIAMVLAQRKRIGPMMGSMASPTRWISEENSIKPKREARGYRDGRHEIAHDL